MPALGLPRLSNDLFWDLAPQHRNVNVARCMISTLWADAYQIVACITRTYNVELGQTDGLMMLPSSLFAIVKEI